MSSSRARRYGEEYYVDSFQILTKFKLDSTDSSDFEALCGATSEILQTVFSPKLFLIWFSGLLNPVPRVLLSHGLTDRQQSTLINVVATAREALPLNSSTPESRRDRNIKILDISVPEISAAKYTAIGELPGHGYIGILIGCGDSEHKTRRVDNLLLSNITMILQHSYERLLHKQPQDQKKNELAGIRGLPGDKPVQEELSALLLKVQEEERGKIAGDLHDGVGQILTLIKIQAENLVRDLDQAKHRDNREQALSLIDKTRQAIEEVRRISMDLRPSILDDLGIVATLDWFCRECSKVYPNLDFLKRVEIDEAELPISLKLVIFRIVQESVNNVIKHAAADLCEISLGMSARSIDLCVKDNGSGFSLADSEKEYSGFGLRGMRERVKLTGGVLEIRSGSSTGTLVKASWPTTSDQIWDA